MEEKRKHPATVAEMALRNIKPDTPLHELMDVVKDALETYGYKDEPIVEPALFNGTPLTDGMFLVENNNHGEMGVLIYKEPVEHMAWGEGFLCHAYLGRSRSITTPYRTFVDYTLFQENGKTFCLATPEEKQLLLDELSKAGYRWDEEHKKVVKQRWKPGPRETYYRPLSSCTDPAPFLTYVSTWMNYDIDQIMYEQGWVFQTKEECDAFCQKLNEAIKNVKV